MSGASERAQRWTQIEAPLIWLLGKTQAGKTSIVAEITGQAHDCIGQGFAPMTRDARIYAFPERASALRFLDTRGLGDVLDAGHDAEVEAARAQAQLILAVVRVDDLELGELCATLAKARRQHPELPLLVAQTHLHACYQRPERHLLPYPFDGADADGERPEVSLNLRRMLIAQRRLFAGLPGRAAPLFVPLDFTRPEYGLAPSDYGAERLWTVLEQTLPELVARLRLESESRQETDQWRIKTLTAWSLSAATANAVPAPLIGGLGSASVQALMVGDIARRFGFAQDLALWREFIAAFGPGFALGYGGRWLAQQGLKLGLGWGTAAVFVWTFATTWALGETARYYFRRKAGGQTTDRQTLRIQYRDSYVEALKQARAVWRERKRDGPYL